MFRHERFRSLWAQIAAVVCVGCSDDARMGQLVVTVQTDMAMPDQIDNVNVQVTRDTGTISYKQDFQVGAQMGDYRVPGTISLYPDNGFEGPVTVRVMGRRQNVWRTYREAVISIPTDRVAELRMPIQWLCNESAKVSTDDGIVLSGCDDETTTCKAGTCQPKPVNVDKQPDYVPENVFGGSADPMSPMAKCFKTVPCMSAGYVVTPDMVDCTIDRPDVGDDRINIALRVAEGGICDQNSTTDTTCFVPLDGQDTEGWMFVDSGDRVQLPPAVCDRIEERKVLAVYASTACESKTTRFPPCSTASSISRMSAIEPPEEDIGAIWPSAELVTELLSGDSRLCCPLMMDQDLLYTCSCSPDGRGTLLSIDPETASTNSLTFNMQPNPAAVVYERTLYWAAVNNIFRVGVNAGSAAPSSFRAPGTVYTRGMMLADAAGVYALTTGTGGESVSLLRFDHDGELMAQDPLGNRMVQQFTQNDSAFYLALNVDQIGRAPFQRISSVVRIDKSTHARATVMEEQTLTISDEHFNGYLGVVSDGTTLFAQFETTAEANGKERLQILRTAANSGAPADPETIFELAVAPDHSTILMLLGAVDGAVIFVREELELTEPVRVRSASVMGIPSGSKTAYYIADFAGDAPASGLAVNADRIFWLNQSGRLFGWDRSVLQEKR